jgi:hypothetical protein
MLGAAMTDIHGLTVQLPDNCRHCESNLAKIDFGEGPHKASLRCCNCIAHRGWTSRDVYAFVEESVRRFGRPTEPIIIRRGCSMNDQKFNNSNRGVLFRDDKKSKPDDRDYSGSINIAGTDYWLSAWIKTSKNGAKFMSLSVKPKVSPEAKSELNDAIGF